MTAKSIDKKVQKGFKKVGQKLGSAFDQHRPDSWIVPLQNRAFLRSVPLAYSQDERFTKNPEDVLDYFTLYTGYSDVKQGDIFSNSDRTLVVMDTMDIRGPVGVACDFMADVLRPIYSMNTDKKTSFQEVATAVPCAFKTVGALQDNPSQVPSKMTGGQSRVEAWFWTPPGLVKLNDVLQVQGNRYLLQEVLTSRSGTKVRGISTRLGL